MFEKTSQLILASGLILSLLMSVAAAQDDNGRGRHKQMYATPTPGNVVVDGKFDDWDLSGQVEMFVIEATRSTQSAKFALMYDAEALYLSGDVNDPTPLMNRHDPNVDPDKGWDADSCQFRLTIDPAAGYPIDESAFTYRGKDAKPDTRDDIVHLLLWHFTDDASANLQMHLGMGYRLPRPEWAPHGLVPQGLFEGKYLKRADNRGYAFEYRIPWKTLGAKRPLAGGDTVAGTVQFNWSRPDGLKTGGSSAWAYDVMGRPGFSFQSTACWGKMIFAKTGNVSREWVEAGVPPERPLPLEFAYELPEDSECTIQLFDQAGKSVRILVAQQARLGGRNIERWDGLDDQGRLMPAGEYVWKGILNQPIKAQYRFSAHNSGTPPYPTDDNKGGWGGDHGEPQAAVALADGMILSWDVCEYGWGIIRTDLEGRKLWGSRHDAKHLATDGQRLYIAGGHGFNIAPEVQILDVKDSRPSRLANGVATIAAPPGGEGADHQVSGLCWHGGKLYVAYAGRDLIGIYETTNGALAATWKVPAPGRLAVRPDGSLAVISKGNIVSVAAGTTTDWISSHLDEPVSIAIAADGTTYVANRGKLQNVSVFAADGKYLRSIGRENGRPAMGAYDPQGLYMPGGIALDSKGRLWAAETTDAPKRISVWDTQTGRNLKEFFGSSGYFAYGHIDPERPDEIYAHNVLWAIDWQKYTVRPKTTIWRRTDPDMAPAPNVCAYTGFFRILTTENGRQAGWGGSDRNHNCLLYLRDGDLFKPVAGIFNPWNGDYPGLAQFKRDLETRWDTDKVRSDQRQRSMFWQDANNDQRVQTDELTPLPKEWARANIAWVGKDLSLRMTSGHVLMPEKLDPQGRPIYDLARAENRGGSVTHNGYLAMLADGSTITLRHQEGPSLVKWSPKGQMLWHYPGLIAWQRALNLSVVKAGRLWGLTGLMGVAGDFFAHQTYFGPNHIFRADGIYVAAILADCRMGGEGADTGQPEGQGGQFVKLNLDGKERYFVIHGGQDSRVWEVHGLDTVKDLPGGVYRHTEEHFARAQAAQQAYEAALKGASRITIARGQKALDAATPVGKRLEGGRGFEARLACDAENLYVRFDVISAHELINAIPDPKIIFRGGNLLDLQLAADPDAPADRKTPAPGDLRLLVTRQVGKPFAVFFQPKVKGFAGTPTVLKSPTGQESFDAIEVVDWVGLEYGKTATGFVATVTVPLKKLGLSPASGRPIKMDLGYIFGNKEGTRTAIRAYVKNSSFSANVVDDIPNESRLEPAEWGDALVE